MIEIIPHLWIGNTTDAFNIWLLKDKKIRLIINLTDKEEFIPIFPEIDKKRVNLKQLPLISEYIHDKLTDTKWQINGYSILIHCQDRIQKAPTVIAYYLIKYGKMTAEQAIFCIKTKDNLAFKPQCLFLSALHIDGQHHVIHQRK